MKNLLILFTVAFLPFNLISCSGDDDGIEIIEVIELPVQGPYSWAFEIPNAGNQVSRHNFGNEMIAYTMTGDVYNVAYNMEVLSYDRNDQKIVAIGEEGSPKSGVYFTIFLKDITDTTVTMYKAELETEQEAENLPVPADDNTDFHGWNTYEKE